MATLIWSSANNSTDKTSIVVPVGTLLENTAYEIRARHKGNITGYGAYGTKTINTLSSFGTTNAPVVSVSGSPVSVTETPTITTNPFSVSSGTDTLESTDWQVYNGATLVWESLANTTDKLSITLPAGLLLAGTAYLFKARHNGTATGQGTYGSITATTLSSFGTANTPTVTVTGEPSSVTETPTITTSAFAVSSGIDTLESTDWQVYNGATLVWESLANTTDKLSITVPAGLLLAGIAYTFKARHNGTVTGASAYGSKTATTLSSFGEPNAPTITVTGELNSVPETPTITLSAFSMTSGNDTHLSTDYEIWRV